MDAFELSRGSFDRSTSLFCHLHSFKYFSVFPCICFLITPSPFLLHCIHLIITLPTQFFVARDVSPDFDMEVYNKMITEVLQNPKYSEYFVPSQ